MTAADETDETDETDAEKLATPRPPTPRPLVVACLLGAVGLVLLIAGAVSSADNLSVAGFVAGSLSLAAALFWRSELIAAHRARKSALSR